MVTPRFESTALLPLLDEARAHLTERLGARADRLAFQVEVDAQLQLDVDRPALLQALQNFLQNAAEAYADDTRTALDRRPRERSRAGSQIEITVA